MRFSQLLCPTLREDPADVEVISHKYMLRAGMIRQVAAGIYSLLPVGLRVMRRVEGIVREEMNRAGAQEVYLPAVQPAELWRESGRWDTIGRELLRFKDRNDRDFCFGPTHEEIITDLVRREVRSYRDLPKNLYQIQVKFRDEVRPRFGLMRGREFIMKDAYSFDADDAGAERSYRSMHEAYTNIFRRCGLTFRAVEADSGNIGGSLSQEFMVLAPSGEDEVVSCTGCEYAANTEKAAGRPQTSSTKALPSAKEKKKTPGKKTVADVAAFLGVAEEQLVKTLLYRTDTEYVAVLIPGNREVNEIKLRAYLQAKVVALASPEETARLTNAPVGFAGPVGLARAPEKIARVISDPGIESGRAYVTGANERDLHWVGVVAGTDFDLGERAEVTRVRAGDRCLKCGGELRTDRGIEVGHIFKLGTKYSESMQARFTDKDGSMKPSVMGCYGIGIGRTAAAAIEQNHDANGPIFPPPLAPFDATIVVAESQKETLRNEGERVYGVLREAGLDPLLDDRDESAGRKFKDADLLGIPVRVTVGEKGLSQAKLEVKQRRQPKGEFIDPSRLTEWVGEALREQTRRST